MSDEPMTAPAWAVPHGAAGDARVDGVLTRLAELGSLPVAEHVRIFEDVHQRLQELLVSADRDEPGPPRPAAPGPRPGA
ncbi:hypothetical protein [Actinomadura macrotermitis]|uniref:Uncharacterized protein n=1 Tax=Actinomadura macrotermitis TaxID=2585200 RepID=A0A7K0C5S1_9ACTN|nr:hypothetical protein [Actinomadura macrotermitis]MQY08452.1 hypothetical protein [Actinomadura macrotermitis]